MTSRRVAVFVFLTSLYLLLGSAEILNVLNIRYSSFLYRFDERVIHIVFFSPVIDHILLYTLSVLIFASPMVVRGWRHGLRWTWCYLPLVPAFLAYLLGGEWWVASLVSLAGFFSVAVTVVSKGFSRFLNLRTVLVRLAVYLSLLLLIVESTSLVCWIFCPLYPSFHAAGIPGMHPVHLETQLFYVTAGLAPVLFYFSLFSWIFRPMGGLRRSLRGLLERIERRLVEFDGQPVSTFRSKRVLKGLDLKYSISILVCSVALTSFYVLYPHLLGLNPEQPYIGTDIPHYGRMMHEMGGGGLLNTLSYAFSRFKDRPLPLLMMYGLWRTTGLSALTVAQFIPLLLGPLFILATYYFMSESTGNSLMSPLAVLFAVSSYPITVGLYAGFLSNWAALVEVYLFSVFFLRSVNGRSWKWFFFATLTLLACLFTHSNTWGMLMGVLGVYALLRLIRWLRRHGSLWDFKMLVVMMVTNLVADVTRNHMLGLTEAATEVVCVGRSNLALKPWTEFCRILTVAFQRGMGGFYINPLMLSLALVGLLTLTLKDDPFHWYLTSWPLASLFPVMLGNHTIQTRILYNLPIHIFAVLGTNFILTLIQRLLKPREAKILRLLLISLFVLVNLNYGFRCTFQLSKWFF